MTVYLVCFARPYHHARHYIGCCGDLAARMQRHARGRGARLMRAVARAGITWAVTRTWEGDRELEKQLKRQHNAPRLCPVCRARGEGHGNRGSGHGDGGDRGGAG